MWPGKGLLLKFLIKDEATSVQPLCLFLFVNTIGLKSKGNWK